MLRTGSGVLIALQLACAAALAGEIDGTVRVGIEGARLAHLGPTVVFLEGGQAGTAPRSPVPVIRQRNARFDPPFLVVVEGQRVEMANDDTIFHNVFSFSRPNDFDLGVYPAGESRTVRFAHAGVVKLYCSIHESMSATVVVVPAPWYAIVSPAGDYRIADVPPGRYRLVVWNEKLPRAERSVTVGATGAVRADFALATGVSPEAAPAAKSPLPPGPPG